MTHQAFVWQRHWTPDVAEAVRTSPRLGLSGAVALAAEIEFDDGRARVVRVPVDFAALGDAGPVALALRIADDPGSDEHMLGPVADLAADLGVEWVAKSWAEGAELAELHLDHDCPTRRLSVCARVLARLRERVAPVPVVFTALPTWLQAPAGFEQMLAASDGYVLQVHALELSPEPRLLDSDAARRAVTRAAEFGRPFRVALPSHGYVLATDATDRLLAVSAEDLAARRDGSGGVTRRLVRSDPAQMAALVAEWARSRPPELEGIVWFRLPVAGDRLNWTSSSLASVVAGKVPSRRVRVEFRTEDSGLVEVDLVNLGETAEPLPSQVAVSWPGPAPVAADGLGGFRWTVGSPRGIDRGSTDRAGTDRGAAGERAVLTRRPSASPVLHYPGERRVIAWLRFAEPQTSLGGHIAF